MTTYRLKMRDRHGKEFFLPHEFCTHEAACQRVKDMAEAWRHTASLVYHRAANSVVIFPNGDTLEYWVAGQSETLDL